MITKFKTRNNVIGTKIKEVLSNSIKGDEIKLPKCTPDYARKVIREFNKENNRFFLFENLKGGQQIREI